MYLMSYLRGRGSLVHLAICHEFDFDFSKIVHVRISSYVPMWLKFKVLMNNFHCLRKHATESDVS